MIVLKDIAFFSNFKPVQGDLLKLFQLVIEKDIDKSQIIDQFQSKNHFNVVYKRLKDKMLDGILLNSFKGLPKTQQQHLKIRKRSLESIMLIYSNKKYTGIKIAQETLQSAEKHGLVDIVLTMSRELENHFAVMGRYKSKWEKYRDKTIIYLEYFTQECLAQSLFSELANCLQYKRDPEYLLPRITELSELTQTNKQYKFRLYYYSIKNLYARSKNDQVAIIETCQEAISFFSSLSTILPYTTQWNFKYQMIPIYLNQKKYAQAELTIKDCIAYPILGSYNWHLTLLYQAILGFYSNKPKITSTAWKNAKPQQKKAQSDLIISRWEIIYAYLNIFAQLGHIEILGSFRLYRFINDTNPVPKAKPNLYIIELLYLLVKKKKIEYMKRVEGVESYIQSQKPMSRRTRYFLRMLKAVEMGDYHPVRVTAHAKKNYNLLKNITMPIDVNVFDVEPVPYEILWDMVLEILEKPT